MANNILIAAALLGAVATGAGAMRAIEPGPASVELVPVPTPVAPPAVRSGCTGLLRLAEGTACDGNGDGARCGVYRCPPAPTVEPVVTSLAGPTPVPPTCDEDPTARPYVEVCDYRDNDCDGLTDEDFKLRLPCSVACPVTDGGVPSKREGTSACNNDGSLGCDVAKAPACP